MRTLWIFLAAIAQGAEKLKDKPLEVSHVFVPDPKFVLEGKRPEGSKENVQLAEANKRWIADRTGKDVTKKMINVPNTMPVTPHGVYKYVDDSPYCWVIMAYDSDEDIGSEIHAIAEKLSEYFYERCGVGMLDMAYPGNKFTFGYLIEDLPMILVKRAGREFKMLQDYIEQDSFVLRDRSEWGERILTDALEDDIDGHLKRILKKYYEPIGDFIKMTSIHMQWYARMDEKKGQSQEVIKLHVQELAADAQTRMEKIDKKQFFEELQATHAELKTKLEDNGFATSPRPVRDLFQGNFDGEGQTKYNVEL